MVQNDILAVQNVMPTVQASQVETAEEPVATNIMDPIVEPVLEPIIETTAEPESVPVTEPENVSNQMVFCRYCGIKMSETSRFCPACGKEVHI